MAEAAPAEHVAAAGPGGSGGNTPGTGAPQTGEPASANHTTGRFKAGDILIRVVLPVFITSGALAKVFYGSPYELPQFILYYARHLLGLGELRTFLSVVAIELCIAAVLAFQPRWAATVARVILSTFIAVLILQWYDSYIRSGGNSGASCGCFGAASPPVGIMLAVECTLLALTFILPRRKVTQDISSARYFALWLLCAVLSIGAFSTYRLQLIGVLRSDQDMIEIELLQEGKGRRFDSLRLAKYVDKKPSDFATGEQYWVLWRRSCPFCHELFKSRFAVRDPGRLVVALEIPMFPEPPPQDQAEDKQNIIYEPLRCDRFETATMQGGRIWNIRTPLVLHIKDGVVVEIDRSGN